MAALAAPGRFRVTRPPSLVGPIRRPLPRPCSWPTPRRPIGPLRPGEFYSAGFLTEGKKLAYGEVLGDVEPPQIANLQSPTTASQFSRIGIIPPKGAAYQVGDSLMIAERITGYSKYGDVIWPTGMARVIEVGPKQTTAVILNQYKRIRIGQVALPLERFTPGGTARAVPVSDGIQAEVIQARSRGRPDRAADDPVPRTRGGRTAWRLATCSSSGARPRSAGTRPPPSRSRWRACRSCASGEQTSSALVVRIISADINPGTSARQVAKLPN